MNLKTVSEFDVELCANYDHIIAKMYKPLLKMDTDNGQVKDCMIKWVKHFGYNIVVSMVEYMKERVELYI